MEELNKAKNDMEKNNTRLTSELKALREKSEKVSFRIPESNEQYFPFDLSGAEKELKVQVLEPDLNTAALYPIRADMTFFPCLCLM